MAAAEKEILTVNGRELVRDGRLLSENRGVVARVEETAGRMREWARTAD